jgi:hypothetical protein
MVTNEIMTAIFVAEGAMWAAARQMAHLDSGSWARP